jgi:enamine deaminase RidA (YjgF/YER057c/UK114 family)
MSRQLISSGAPWESVIGYSRAVRVGNFVAVSGTTAINAEGQLVGKDDPYAQTIFIIQKMEKALKEAGAELKDVIRTRMFVTDISKWEAVGRAHGEFFKDIRPAATMVEVSKLIDTGLMIEIEMDAVIP